MFTGLVKAIGTLTAIEKNLEGHRFTFNCPALASQIKIDDSVSVNGVCLTAVANSTTGFEAQAVHVTLEKTNLGNLEINQRVNLELAMSLSDRLGGHLVQGHVNTTATLKSISSRGENFELWFTIPAEQMKYIIKEGSITLDGISLTVADIQENNILITIIPHTWENTILQDKKIGDTVNLEVDMMAKYLENFLKHGQGVYGKI